MSGAGKLNEKEQYEILTELIVKCRIAMRRAACVVVNKDASESERQRAARELYGVIGDTDYLDPWKPRTAVMPGDRKR